MSHSRATISKVQQLLSKWDKGSAVIRSEILSNFLINNYGKTGPELEQELGQCASLFLNRLTAWLRLTYMMGACIGKQLQAIQIFLSATSG